MFCFLLFQRVDDILQFIGDYTVDLEGVGHVCRSEYILHFYNDQFRINFLGPSIFFFSALQLVCLNVERFCQFLLGSFSTFDFQKHGNSNYGSPYHTPSSQRSSQGKMEKSFLRYEHYFFFNSGKKAVFNKT